MMYITEQQQDETREKRREFSSSLVERLKSEILNDNEPVYLSQEEYDENIVGLNEIYGIPNINHCECCETERNYGIFLNGTFHKFKIKI